MRWKGRRESSNIEDRRGQSGGGGGFGFPFPMPNGRSRMRTGRQRGGMSLMTILIIMAVMFFFPSLGKLFLGSGGPLGGGLGSGKGGRLEIPLPGGSSRGQQSGTQVSFPRGRGQVTRPSRSGKDELARFVAVVLADNEDVWREQFRRLGRTYTDPKLVIYSRRTRSGCGIGMSQMGPFYCPADRKVYIDLDFYRELRTKFGAGGDFAQAYVISHEIGHHVQTLLGISDKVQRAKRRSSKRRANAIQVRMELQADCFAGVWAHNAQRSKKILEEGDLEEAIRAAQAIGDDTLQRRSTGYVRPDTFTHGTSAQRMRWFKRGVQSGRIQACDTFGARDV